MKDYYRTLQVNAKASKEIIEKAYKTLIKKYHPDLHQGEKAKYSEEVIKEINEAYDILSDDFLREQYDKELEKEEVNRINRLYAVKREKERQQRQQTTQNYTEENSNNNYYNSNFSKNKYDTNKVEKKEGESNNNTNNIGTFKGILDVLKAISIDKSKIKDWKNITQKDLLALILTIIIMLVLGVILWIVPFTNSWMRELFENPLFSWIGKLFAN